MTVRLRYAVASVVTVGALVAGLTACSTAPAGTTDAGGSGPITVVAAENFWGSIARQLGGSHVNLTSIITNPATDPHDYEPTPADARTIATAQLVIVNGIGYDSWATKLLAANPDPRRTVLTVGNIVGVADGGNPHRWYSPTNVGQVIDQITADYQRVDPANAAYFYQRKKDFQTKSLAAYHQLIVDIKAKYAGTPIGASESIVTPLAQGLGLTMLTPAPFLDAISEGSDPTAADKATIDNQIKTKQIKIYVYNSQNATPDVRAQVNEAKAAGIPVTTVTETLDPATSTFQDWQVTQLKAIEAALARGTGKR
jgi:zinc/manganese transport system substrate-binding protein